MRNASAEAWRDWNDATPRAISGGSVTQSATLTGDLATHVDEWHVDGRTYLTSETLRFPDDAAIRRGLYRAIGHPVTTIRRALEKDLMGLARLRATWSEGAPELVEIDDDFEAAFESWTLRNPRVPFGAIHALLRPRRLRGS